MQFFDCNCFIGLPATRMQRPVANARELLHWMDRVGIERALLWHTAQRDWSATVGNQLLAEAIAPHRDRLVGCWAFVPNQWREMPPPEEFCARMAEAGVRATVAFPRKHNFLLRRESCGALLETLVRRRIPLLLPVREATEWRDVYDLLAQFPNLVCILGLVNTCNSDRYWAPLLEAYGEVYLEGSEFITDGGIEAFVERFGAHRLLFGTAFPARGQGGMMLALKHACISEVDKQAIAWGNLEGLLGRAEL